MKLFPPAFQPIHTGAHVRRKPETCDHCGAPAPRDVWDKNEYYDHLVWDCRQEM